MKIDIGRLNKVYRGGIHALNDVDLTIASGMSGLLGPNGAGKTTLMRILAGILRPTSGDLYIGEFDGNTEKGRTSVKRMLGSILRSASISATCSLNWLEIALYYFQPILLKISPKPAAILQS